MEIYFSLIQKLLILKVKIFYNHLIKSLLHYFEFKPLIKEKASLNYITEIEKEFELYKRLRKKNEPGFKKIISELEISFVHHSLSLEGNPITLPETIKILKNPKPWIFLAVWMNFWPPRRI